MGVQSREVNVDKSAHFQVWRTITLGSYKGVDAYRDAPMGDVCVKKLGSALHPTAGRMSALARDTNHLAPRQTSNRRQSADSACVKNAARPESWPQFPLRRLGRRRGILILAGRPGL
jgi:hypothetical protein